MTGDCMGDLEDPPNCANDIFGLLVRASQCVAVGSVCDLDVEDLEGGARDVIFCCWGVNREDANLQNAQRCLEPSTTSSTLLRARLLWQVPVVGS